MDRNSVIGLVLIGLILIGFSVMNTPSPQEMAAMKHKQDSIALVEKQKLASIPSKANVNPIASSQGKNAILDSTVSDSAALAIQNDQLGSFADAGAGTEELITIENDVLKVTLTSKGGRVKSSITGHLKLLFRKFISFLFSHCFEALLKFRFRL